MSPLSPKETESALQALGKATPPFPPTVKDPPRQSEFQQKGKINSLNGSSVYGCLLGHPPNKKHGGCTLIHLGQ